MSQPDRERGVEKRDLVLHPGEFTYMQDQTRGSIKTHVGPTVVNQTAQELPVVFNPEQKRFIQCSLEQAVARSPLASEGEYIVLENPAQNNERPDEGSAKASPTLSIGRKVNIPGPCQFALWPGQLAKTIAGHHLRSNQYLVVRIYNEQQARQNWGNAVVVQATTEQGPNVPPITSRADSLTLTIGKQLIIKGTEVSFYIPPTGVEVIPAQANNYVREAVTLERLEYAILVDENGNKRYEKGPQVVFPNPTEIFFEERGSRKFKAIELNKIQGLHIKVIAEYDEEGVHYGVGEELFITGDDTPIYYPRVEHSIVRYGEKNKHYATALPAGEGRYVMNRETGEIVTERGPAMLLPDPRKHVIVRRILSDKQCTLWYPSNQEALLYNQQLRALANEAPSARSGFVSEGDVQRNVQEVRTRGAVAGTAARSAPMKSFAATAQVEALELADESGGAALPDVFVRGTSYTQPRTVTLDTKYEGVPAICVWTGYAVMVVSKTGTRRVVIGPATILLNYDESLEVLELSTGKPKNTDRLEKTVYLRVANNKVSDIVSIKTRDLVDVTLKLSYRVNFEGEADKWFSVENYVKFLCDHVRSVLKGNAQKRKVEEYSSNGVDIIRDVILGTADTSGTRPGMAFAENGMRITDVEVLGIEIDDKNIAGLLNKAQHDIVRANIELHQAEKQLEVAVRSEEISRLRSEAEAATAKRKAELQTELIAQQLAVTQAKIMAELTEAQKQKEVVLAKEDVNNVVADSDLARRKASADQEISIENQKVSTRLAALEGETKATVARFGAAQHGFSEALLQIQGQETLTKVAEALSVQNFIGGKDFVEVFRKLFAGLNLDGIFGKVAEKAGDGGRLTPQVPSRR